MVHKLVSAWGSYSSQRRDGYVVSGWMAERLVLPC